MNAAIAYKGIVHNVLNDAPFIGAIVIANSCSYGCKDCINEHLKKDAPTYFDGAKSIISKVKENGLNEGVIFSGLEWTEQGDDLVLLVKEALRENLKVMIYTHHTEISFYKLIPELMNAPVYVKFGAFVSHKQVEGYYSYSVKLATSNQYIKYLAKSS